MGRIVTTLALVAALGIGGCGAAGGGRGAALAAFARDVEPEVDKLLSGVIFDSPVKPMYTKPARFGFQEGNNPLDNPYGRGENVFREGRLSIGATFWAQGHYSYQTGRIDSVEIIVDFPDLGTSTTTGNVPITRPFLKSLRLSQPLIDGLMKGRGKGSMSGPANLDFQASATLGGKHYEASTAIQRGTPLALDLRCSYNP